MLNKFKKLPAIFSLLAMLLLVSVSFSAAATSGPEYSGHWKISFFDASGNLLGSKTIEISDDGSISDKAILSIDNTIYLTELSAIVSPKGKVTEGTLIDTDKLEMKGSLTGSFTKQAGSGEWKNYYNKKGTWKAERPPKQENE